MNRLYLTFALVLLVLPATVQAYIDPGTGSLILQFVIAGVLGVVFFFRQTAARFMSFFRSKPAEPDDGHDGRA